MHQEQGSEELVFNVLGYREDDDWVALALEMDLRGYGPTFEAALEELAELVEAQISFAAWKGHLEMIWNSAEPEYFERYESALHSRVEALYSTSEREEPAAFRVAGIPVPPPHVIAANRETFQPANA